MPANRDEIEKRKNIALAAIRSVFGTEEDEYGATLFVSHHLNEIEETYWQKHLGAAQPEPSRVLDILELRSHWSGEDDDGIETFDFTLPDLLTQEECQDLIAFTEGIGYEAAPITTGGGFVMRPDIRNNARVIIDDVRRAEELWRQMRAEAPQILDGRQAIGLNERFRFYRYDPGERFAPHIDGPYRRGNGEESLLTFMVYLNGGFGGGETNFGEVWVTPETGLGLLFDHYLLHEGTAVTNGRKYVLRSDVMYGPVGQLRG